MSETELAHPGRLITFEGSEGSGKTTQIGRLATLLEDAGYEVVVTREPGGTELGEQIRHLLKHTFGGAPMAIETELLLFAAARAQLVRELIIPAREAGKIILCDRFLDSTTVYQGMARKIAQDPIRLINDFAVGSMEPDMTIVLDVPAEVGMNRIKKRVTDIPDRMEQENIGFYKRVREGYLMLAKQLPGRFRVIDGTRDVMEIEAEIWDEVSQLLLSVEA
ncbi:MAG: dTMP kinase [Opitutales bacterium]